MNTMAMRVFLACASIAALLMAAAFVFCGSSGCLARPVSDEQSATMVAMAAEMAATMVSEQARVTITVSAAEDAFPTIAIPATTVVREETETPTIAPTAPSTPSADPSPTVTAILVPALNPTLAATVEPTIQPTAEPTPLPAVAPTDTVDSAAAREGTITGLAIIGDSTQDEYRGNPEREGDFPTTTRNWVELLIEQRGFNVGDWGQFPEPRNEGYAYNWARNGATTQQMLSTGQHEGAAAQCAQELASHVVIQIGINDFSFSTLGTNLYEGSVESSSLNATLNFIASNIATAAETVKNAGCEVLVAATQDYISIPVVAELYSSYQDSAGRERLIAAFAYLNDEIERRVTQLGIPFFDYNAAYLAELEPRLDGDGHLLVGNAVIDLETRGGEAHHGLLDDEYIHPGTVLSGLTANVYLAEFNRVFGTQYALLSDAEILKAAGIPQ